MNKSWSIPTLKFEFLTLILLIVPTRIWIYRHKVSEYRWLSSIEYNLGMSKFYTMTGDDGTSGLLGKGRVPKNHPRLNTIGDIDEANASLGIARSACKTPETQEIILTIQKDLYGLMSELSSTPENTERFQYINASHTQWIEDQIEVLGREINLPSKFIIPGDTLASAYLDLARSIVRRAERRICGLFQSGELNNSEILKYMNRLSSLCYILELWEINGLLTTQPSLTRINQE